VKGSIIIIIEPKGDQFELVEHRVYINNSPKVVRAIKKLISKGFIEQD